MNHVSSLICNIFEMFLRDYKMCAIISGLLCTTVKIRAHYVYANNVLSKINSLMKVM